MTTYKLKTANSAIDIRPAQINDAQEIADIWNPNIRDTINTFTNLEKTNDDIVSLINSKKTQNHAFYVAVIDGQLVGFATYGPFRNGPGYAYTMEHTVMLTPIAQGGGVAKVLMQTLETHAKQAGIHSMFAGVSAENSAGVAFHHAIGYETVVILKRVGFKFNRWHDLVLMQKIL